MNHLWDVEVLLGRLGYCVLHEEQSIQEILYQGEMFQGKATEVFAYVGIPKSKHHLVPGMVLVHGGGGKAFRHWVEMWVERGYAAIAMDLGGCDAEGKRLAHPGPMQDHNAKFDVSLNPRDMWTYHAVAAAIRARGILRSAPGVDSNRIGITGISWGGYVTCIAAAVDTHFACAIPIYGCGFLQQGSAEAWMEVFAGMSSEQRQEWHQRWDPSVYLAEAPMPMLFVSGTNDIHYPLNLLEMSAKLPRHATRCFRPGMGHSHEAGWVPKEIEAFANQHSRGGAPLPNVGLCQRSGDQVHAKYETMGSGAEGYLVFTEGHGPWPERTWQSIPATLTCDCIQQSLPKAATAYFLALEDERGLWVNSPVVL